MSEVTMSEVTMSEVTMSEVTMSEVTMSEVTMSESLNEINPTLCAALGAIDIECSNEIELEGNLSEVEMVAVASTLRHHPITVLKMEQSKFSKDQFTVLFDALEVSASISELVFGEANFADFDNYGYVRLMQLLGKSTSLQYLTVAPFNITKTSARFLEVGLINSRSLIGFKLQHAIDFEAVRILLKAGLNVIENRKLAMANANMETMLKRYGSEVTSPLPTDFNMIVNGIQLRMNDEIYEKEL